MDMNPTTVEDWSAQGEEALSARDWAAAARAYEALVAMLPRDADSRYKLARAYEQLGRLQDMRDVLSDPAVSGLPQAKRILASAYMAAKDYAAAMPLIEELIPISPGDTKLDKWKTRCEEKLSSRKVAAALQRGKSLVSEKRLEEAEQAYLDLLADYPDAAGVHSRLAQIYMVQKRWADALNPLRAALAMEPEDAEIRTLLARALFKSGEPAEAVATLISAGACGENTDALFLLQRSHMDLRNWEGVEEAGARLLSLLALNDPLRSSVSELLQNAAVERQSAASDALLEVGAFEEAIRGYRDLASRYPQAATASLRLATALADADQDGEAIDALKRYLELRPEDMEARRTLTRLIVKALDEQSVLEYVREAIAAERPDVECYRWLGRYNADRGDWHASLESLQHAFEMEPHNAPVRLGLARALCNLRRFAEALDQLDVLIAGDAKLVQALDIKAEIFVQLGRIEDAIAIYELALTQAPKHPLINFKLSQALLLKGDIEGFHRLNEKRRDLSSFTAGEEQSAFEDWDGRLPIEGKLLVWAEAGLSIGQNILHLSVLPLLAGLGLKIVLEVPPELTALCRRSFPDMVVVSSGAQLPDGISHQAPIGSLSRWLKPDLESFDSMRPYLVPDRDAARRHRARLQRAAGDSALLVGVCLADDEETGFGASPLDEMRFCGAIALPRVALVSLKAGSPPKIIGSAALQAGERMIEGLAGPKDLDDLTSILSAMDLVVCTDSVIAHLSGAAGIPTFILLRAAPAAHWLAQGESSIWYPSAQLFRGSHIDQDWDPVLHRVRDAVDEYAGGYNPSKWTGGTAEAMQGSSLTPDAICDAARAFVVQGPLAPAAYRSALELIDRVPAGLRSRAITMLRGDLLVRFGRWDEALAVYESLAPAQASDPEVDEHILSVSLAMYDLESALSIARRLAGRDPAHRLTAANILYHLRRSDEALSELRAASMQAVQPDRLSILFGTLLLERGEYERAEAYLRDQAAMTSHADIHTLMARSFGSQGRVEEALTAFDRALSLAEDDPNANFWRAQERIGSGLATSVPLPPLLGDLPEAAPEDVVIFFVADASYFWQHGLVLLNSIGCRSSSAICHVHVINPDDGVATAIERVREMVPGLRLSFSFEHKAFEACSDDYLRTYYASVRFVRLAEISARAPAIYLSLDADCIVRGDILAGELGRGDVGVRMRYDERPHATVAAGALRLRPSEGAARFIDRVALLIRSTLETGEAVWFLDQIVLSHVLRELGGSEITVDQLSMSYIDWFFQDGSLIWTGKGPRKLADSRYTDELSKYRKIQEDERISALMPAAGDQFGGADSQRSAEVALRVQERRKSPQ